MLTVFVLATLAYGWYRDRQERQRFSTSGRVAYVVLAGLALYFGVASDLKAKVPMPTQWLLTQLHPWVQSFLYGGSAH